MDSPACASDLAEHLYAALTLTERAALLQQASESWLKQKTDAPRAATSLAAWRAQKPFTAANNFDKRLLADGLTDEKLLAILGLQPEAYAELVPASPEWLRHLEELYSTACPPSSGDQELLQGVEQGTNAFLWVAYPLIQEGLRRFREGADRLPVASAPFEKASAERVLLPNLFATLKAAVEKVMVLELNVARIQGLLHGELSEDRFRSFCSTLGQPEARWRIVREYPVLFRSLHTATINWVNYSLDLLDRLSKDWDVIRETLAPSSDPDSLTAVSIGVGDKHRRGKTVAILGFSSGLKLVYKPRRLSLDVHFGEVLAWVNQTGFEPGFRTLKIIDRGCYGWSEFATNQPCSNRCEVRRFYQRLGGYLAVFHALKATDMHFENLIAAGEFPVPVDLETVLHPETEEMQDPAAGVCLESVLRVLLLPRRVFASETEEGVDISGLGAKSGQYYPSRRFASWEAEATDEMRLAPGRPTPMEVTGNRPKLGEQDVALDDFLEDFVAGFERIYRLIEAHREDFLAYGGILDRFAEDEVRFVGRATSLYGMLLAKSFHPDRLRNAIDRDQLFDSLWLSAGNPPLNRLIPAEREDLHTGDVPLFAARPNSRDLWTSQGERISEFFEQTAIEGARQAILQFKEEDLKFQTRLIRGTVASTGERALSMTHRKLTLSSGGRDTMGLARAVGDDLCRECIESESYANWIGLTPVGVRQLRWSLEPLDWSLYSGLSGSSFFLAYLGASTGTQSYSRIARKSINLVLHHLERSRASGLPIGTLGGYSGLGGIIYTLAHLGFLWQDAALVEEANELAAGIPTIINTDEMLDVTSGCAGCIVSLAVLNQVSPGKRLLDAAVLCGERILGRQQPQDIGAAWKTEIAASQPLTGFAHGAAGIAWALLKLAAWNKDRRYRAAAESAIAYERSVFSVEKANWPDFRSFMPDENQVSPRFPAAWCHGAPGIALARIDSLQFIDDPETREEIRAALRAMFKSSFGAGHCLCHGDLGNLDILQYAAQHGEASCWNEFGKELAAEVQSAIAESGCACGPSSSVSDVGLMTGLAGVGYGLMRLALPERVPSVLVLAPPPQM